MDIWKVHVSTSFGVDRLRLYAYHDLLIQLGVFEANALDSDGLTRTKVERTVH